MPTIKAGEGSSKHWKRTEKYFPNIFWWWDIIISRKKNIFEFRLMNFIVLLYTHYESAINFTALKSPERKWEMTNSCVHCEKIEKIIRRSFEAFSSGFVEMRDERLLMMFKRCLKVSHASKFTNCRLHQIFHLSSIYRGCLVTFLTQFTFKQYFFVYE